MGLRGYRVSRGKEGHERDTNRWVRGYILLGFRKERGTGEGYRIWEVPKRLQGFKRERGEMRGIHFYRAGSASTGFHEGKGEMRGIHFYRAGSNSIGFQAERRDRTEIQETR